MIRCFIVGCPRSGTTLLQAMLGAPFKVLTFPESHFFQRSFKGKRAFFLRGLQASRVLRRWLRSINAPEHYIEQVPRFAYARRPVVDIFVSIMDDFAGSMNKTC